MKRAVLWFVFLLLPNLCLIADEELSVLAVPMEEGVAVAAPMKGENAPSTLTWMVKERWIVEFEPLPLATRLEQGTSKKQDPPNTYKQLSSTNGSHPKSRTPLHGQFREELASLAGSVQLTGRSNQTTTKSIEPEIEHEYVTVYWGVSARFPEELVPHVRDLPYVRRVVQDQRVQVVDDVSNGAIGAPEALNELGLTGQGVVIAIIDTGIDTGHPAFAGKTFFPGFDFVQNDDDPFDDHGHGTHCAGIAAANSEKLVGVAPDASLMAIKVLSEHGIGTFSDIIAGIEFAVDPDSDPTTDDNADVINLSLGGIGSPDDPLSIAVDEASRLGVLVVAAAGNSGTDFSINSPGCSRSALTVGASYRSGEGVASYSSRGPTAVGMLLKPDLVAPGSNIYSSLPGGSYGNMDGTSMATPHVAGAAALLMQQYPNRSPAQIKAMLVQSASDLGLPVFDQGSGLLNIPRAHAAHVAVHPVSLTCGMIDTTVSLVEVEHSIWLHNFSETGQTFTLSNQLPDGVTLLDLPEEAYVGPKGILELNLIVQIDNSVVPYTIDGLPFVGRLLISTPSDTIDLPILIYKSQFIELAYSERPWFTYVHDGKDFGKFIAKPEDSNKIYLVPGIYDFITCFEDIETVHIAESVQIPEEGNAPILSINQSDCSQEYTFQFVDELGDPAIPDHLIKGALVIQDSGLENGVFLTGGLFDKVQTNSSTYSFDIANAFITDDRVVHSHSTRLTGSSPVGTYVNPVNDTHSIQFHWDGGIYDEIIVQPIIPMIFDRWAMYNYSLIYNDQISNIQAPPIDLKFVASGHPSPDSAVGIKQILFVARNREKRNVLALSSPPFDLTESSMRVLADREAHVASFKREGPPITMGGAPVFFSGQMMTNGQHGIFLKNFEHAPSFFVHSGHSLIPQLEDGETASKCHYIVEQDASVLAEGDIFQNGIFWNDRHIPLPGPGDYKMTVDYSWERSTAQFNARLIAEFNNSLPFKPRMPGGIYVMDQSGRQCMTKTVSDSLSVQIHFPSRDIQDLEQGTFSLFLKRPDYEIELPLHQVDESILTAPIPDSLSVGDYDLELQIQYGEENRLVWQIEPAVIVEPFRMSLSVESVEDYQPPETTIATIETTGASDSIEYALIQGFGDDHNEYIQLNNDQLIVRREFDHYDIPVLKFRIRASDDGVVHDQVFSLRTVPGDFAINIPDPQLLAAIRDRTGFEEGDIMRSELAEIRDIYVSDVNDWSGLEHAVGVDSLGFRNQSELPSPALFRRFKLLRTVILNECTLDDLLWMEDLRNLSTISIFRSDISDWTLPVLKLDYLNFWSSGSNLEDLAQLGDPQMINDLQISECPLRSLDGIERFERLFVLRVQNQVLNSIQPLVNMPGLLYLFFNIEMILDQNLDPLKGLNLVGLELDGFDEDRHADFLPPGILSLTLRNGKLTMLGFIANKAQLTSLEITSCGLTQLPNLSVLPDLETLRLSNNSIMDISEISVCENLQHLTLIDNQLMDISPLLDLPLLKHVDLRHNFLDTSPGSAQMKIIDDLVDNSGAMIYYSDQNKVEAEAGEDLLLIANQQGYATASLDASGCSGPLESYRWSWSDGHASGVQADAVLPVGISTLHLEATDILGSVHSDSLQVDVRPYMKVPGSGLPVSQWMQNKYGFLSKEERSLDVDFDGDGLLNIQEYAFGLDPLKADGADCLTVTPELTGPEVTFRFRADDPDVQIVLCYSTGGWKWFRIPLYFNHKNLLWESITTQVNIEGRYLKDGIWEFRLQPPISNESALFRLELSYQ